MTFTERARNYPPPLCRMMARKKGGKPFTQLEIAEASGLTPQMVEAITFSMTWNSIPFGTMMDFLRGCNMDFTNWPACHRMDEFIKSNPQFEHLVKSPEFKTYWMPLLKRWRIACEPVSPTVWKPLRKLLIRLTPLMK